MFDTITKAEKITEGLRKSFQSTECKMANRACYGYNTQPDGELVINEAEAKVVRWIFDRYLAGDSFGKIAAGLEKQGTSSPTGKDKWNREAISKLLSNEKYTGSDLMQKTLCICGTQFKNDGELEQVLIRNHHDAIIPVHDFERVQETKNERAKSPAQEAGIGRFGSPLTAESVALQRNRY